MKHAAIYVPSLFPGGAERVMVTVANGLAASGMRVDLVLPLADGPLLADVASDVRIENLSSRRVIGSLPALVRYLRRTRPDALLSAISHANVVALVAREIAAVPTRIVVSERSTLSRAIGGSNRAVVRWLPHLMRFAYRRADTVVAVSQGVADDLAATIRYPRERIRVIGNPVVDARLLERAKAPCMHPWLQPGEPPVVLGAGRLTQAKGFATLIRAFGRVRERLLARLIIIGEGELRAELEGLVEELNLKNDVDLPGHVQNPLPWMRRSALFALASHWEGLPNVLIEAMACGTPVVSTDCQSGPSEILEGGKWGRLVAVSDSMGLAEAIIATLSSKGRPDVAQRAAHYGVGTAVDEYARALKGHHD